MINTWEARARGAPPWIDDENDDRDEADDDEDMGALHLGLSIVDIDMDGGSFE